MENDYVSELPDEAGASKLVLEAETVYIQLAKDVPVSRGRRFQWFLDRLNTFISVSNYSSVDSSASDIQVVSITPIESGVDKYLITPNTDVKFLAYSYNFIYCIDMSPSHSAIDTVNENTLLDQALSCFKTSLLELCKQFVIPGTEATFHPDIYLTVIVNSPFFINPAQRVLIKGVKVTDVNVQEVVREVESQFSVLEKHIVTVTSAAYKNVKRMMKKSSNFTANQKISNDHIALHDANFVNMIRYCLLVMSFLPKNSLSHILVITDGVLSVPDNGMMESLLNQLHYESISISFLKIGPTFSPQNNCGYIAYTDLLHFISRSTLGVYVENFIHVKSEPALSMNFYHHSFLLWSFYSKNAANFFNFLTFNNTWIPTNSTFFPSKMPILLTKKQAEESVTTSMPLLFCRRMREGYTVDHIKCTNQLLEVSLTLEWKTFIYINYCVTYHWPSVKNLARIEVHISAPYEFLHDITCLIKKETKSSCRQANIERFWLRLTQLSPNETHFFQQLNCLQYSSVWYTLPETVKSGLPLFVLNNSVKLSLLPSDASCPNFVKVWQPICLIESRKWKSWFHTHKFTVVLKYDHPLPKHLHLPNSLGRYQIVQCRQAATALYSMLVRWSSFVLIDNHTYIKLLYQDPEKPPVWFCIIRVVPKFPCVVIRIGFMTGTPGYILHTVLDELKAEFSTVTYLASPLKEKETVCCTMLENSLEKIVIRYERMPSDFTIIKYPDGTNLIELFPSPNLYTPLSQYLYHKRWIWSTSHSCLSKLDANALSRILNTLTRMRLKEGFNFAHSSSGIVTMVLELSMQPARKCAVQYVLFSPHNTWHEGDITSSSEEDPDSELDSELQMISEVWVEPQYGVVEASSPAYLTGKQHFEIPEAIFKNDSKCINSLLAIEHLSLICQNKMHGLINETEFGVDKDCTSKQKGKCNVPHDIVNKIQNVPFDFDPISVLPYCHQTELLFSTFIENNEMLQSEYDFQKPNRLLLENLQEHLLSLHDQELVITDAESDRLTQQILARHKSVLRKDVFSPQWRCFIKGISVTHIILTFVPANLYSLKMSVLSDDVPLTLPLYIYDCSLGYLIETYLTDLKIDYEKCDVFEDHRFKLESVVEDAVRLNDTAEETSPDESEINIKSSLKQHNKALILAHSKCFVTSLFSALQYGAFVHSLDVQLAMDQCEETLYDIDISHYLKTVCGHLKPEYLDADSLKQQSCNELKPFHRLIKEKFFEIMNVAFSQIPTNRDFYYFRDCLDKSSLKIDSDDEVSSTQSDCVEFKQDKDTEIPSNVSESCEFCESKMTSFSNCGMPLFLHLLCTISYNGLVEHKSVKLLPTCLSELLQSMEFDLQSIFKSNLSLTLDVLCLTLPLQVLNVLNDYSAKGLRTTSFCSDGFQPSIDSNLTENSYTSELNSDLLNHIPEVQSAALINLRQKIKWLLKDEIVTALLDCNVVTADTLKYVSNHIADNLGCSSCILDIIELYFVYDSNQCFEKFIDEFIKTKIPPYKLQKEDDFYYVTKNPGASSLQDCVPFEQSLYKNDYISCKSQSDISSINESFLGTDGGYDEDISEEEQDFTWLLQMEDKRLYLPNFWLIMQVDQKAVTIYFHCRFLELPTTYVGTYLQVQRVVQEAIQNLCKKVNQFMLLRSLHDTRICDFLLEADTGWYNENKTPILNRNASYSRLKSMDETNDDFDQYPIALTEISLKFTAGYFSCPVVWEAQFILHPRLKSGPGKPSLSRGVHALKSILDKLSVSNRTNMFVYKDVKSNVFYLRLYENFQNSKTFLMHKNAAVIRSPSITSLPQECSALTQSQHSLGSSTTSKDSDIRPRVRSFGEHESKNVNEDMLVLKVHGITEAGEDIRCGLVQVLQNRLDDAVLECLSVMLARNALCPLTPEDVHFLQKPFQMPEIVIKLYIQDYALKYLESFVHYLHQNLLQFLNIPKYTDSRSHCHFKDYAESETNTNKFLDEKIFIYNQSQNPTSGSKGIACISVAVIQKNNSHSNFDGNFADLFKKYSFQEIVNVKRLTEADELTKTYLEFRLWKQGKDVFADNLFQKLSSATSQALWDIIVEYYLLQSSLCETDARNVLKTVTDYNRLIDPITPVCYSNKEVECEVNIINLNEDAEFKRSPTPPRQKRKDPIKKPIQLTQLELGNDGILTKLYAKFLQKWFEFGIKLSAPAVRKVNISLSNWHLINIIIKELKNIILQLSADSTINSFQFVNFENETVLVPFEQLNSSADCLVIARNAEQWKICTKENPLEYRNIILPKDLKNFQKFTPVVIGESKFIPRQKILWAVVTNSNLLVYTYNWSKDKMDKLIELLTDLGSWFNIRSGFLNSVVAQKLGIFYNQPVTRNTLLASNPFRNFTTDMDCILKFPKDKHKRYVSSETKPIPLLETFRDSYHCEKIEQNDPVAVFAYQVQELNRAGKKCKDELKKLHLLWQSRTSVCTNQQIEILKQNSRVNHFCFTPLLFLSGWRLQSASTRDYSLIRTNSNITVEKKRGSHDIQWHNRLCYNFVKEFKRYLQTLGFIPLHIENSTGKLSEFKQNEVSCHSNFFVQKAMLGGILIFSINLSEPFLSTKLHIIECNRLQPTNSKTSINQFTLSFLDDCDRIRNFTHIHSFTYDYHLRSIRNYVTFEGNNLCEDYHLIGFLDEFVKYYSKAPNFARNLVYEDTITITHLPIEGKHLYDYLLSNVTQYGMEVYRMHDKNNDEVEYSLIQISNAPQMSYKDSQDLQHTDDFDIAVVVTYTNTEKDALSLKYYLILTCQREIYPKGEVDHTLGKFRKVSSTYSRMLLGKQSETSTFLLEIESENDQHSLENVKFAFTSEIKQEIVNYVGYYSTHEQFMQKLILDRAAITKDKINNMVTQGMVDCRTHLLWNKFVSPQDINVLSYSEFIELKNLTKLKKLKNLGTLLDQPLTWYQGLAKLLLTRYIDQHRIYISPDGNTQHYAFLHPRYDGGFMLLSMDLIVSRGDLYAAYRSSYTYKDSNIAQADRKALLDGFINCVCFYLWTGLM